MMFAWTNPDKAIGHTTCSQNLGVGVDCPGGCWANFRGQGSLPTHPHMFCKHEQYQPELGNESAHQVVVLQDFELE